MRCLKLQDLDQRTDGAVDVPVVVATRDGHVCRVRMRRMVRVRRFYHTPTSDTGSRSQH